MELPEEVLSQVASAPAGQACFAGIWFQDIGVYVIVTNAVATTRAIIGALRVASLTKGARDEDKNAWRAMADQLEAGMKPIRLDPTVQ